MAKRDIERALKRKGIRIEQLSWEWTPTPEEMVPTWMLEVNEEDADRFGIDDFHFFDNTEHALREIDEWEELEPAA
jgi:hypothetical protein